MIDLHLFFCRLLDRDHVDAEEVSIDVVEENEFLKAFKVFFASLLFLPLLLLFSPGRVVTGQMLQFWYG